MATEVAKSVLVGFMIILVIALAMLFGGFVAYVTDKVRGGISEPTRERVTEVLAPVWMVFIGLLLCYLIGEFAFLVKRAW